MTDLVGQQLGNYRLIRRLGEGGFAEVYLGEHVYLKTQAAIKVLQTRLASDKHETFLAEARSIAHLKHINIVRVLEFGLEGATPFLVMDYAPNGSLRQRHPVGTPLSLTEILPYVKQVSSALQYAHNQKLIHRDVKPENMLLGPRNELLLSDFGIALVIQSTGYQYSQEIVGTVTYMAPEQFQDRPLPASDQYALGAVVYEWLSGDYPFHGSFIEIASQHLLVPPLPLREKNPNISHAVEEVVLKALEKDPQQRFPSVSEFASALDQACQAGQRSGVAAVTVPFNSSLPLTLPADPKPDSATHPTPDLKQSIPTLPIQEQPRRPYLSPARKILLFILVLLLAMASSSGLTYYATVVRPTQVVQAQATSTAQTRQLRGMAQASATALVVQKLYTQAISAKPALASPLNANDAFIWDEYDSIGLGSCVFKGKAYHVSTSLGSTYVTCFIVGANSTFDNFAFQVEMTIIRGDIGGVYFRYSNSGGYNFLISQDGSYNFTVFTALGEQHTLLNGFSPAIKTGLNQSNLIALIARGSSFYLYVNKQYIALVRDSTSSSGSIALTAQNSKHTTEVAFRNAQIWNL